MHHAASDATTRKARRVGVGRPAHATRVAFLVDAQAYFGAFVAAARKATESILIVGWDVHSETQLLGGTDRGEAYRLAPFLMSCARRQPGLQVHTLQWDFSALFTLERELLTRRALGERRHPRLHCELDDHHPTGAAHHQKIVVIDDRVAFAGGLDLCDRRWDTSDHVLDDERRRDAGGRAYPPFHDAQMMVEGEAARILGEIARDRWQRATGRRIRVPQVTEKRWPDEVGADATDVVVDVLRTDPGLQAREPLREVEAHYVAALEQARDLIYLENQYFTSRRVADAMVRRLAEPTGPEIVLVVPEENRGWLEEATMGALQSHNAAMLRERDPHGRLHFYTPVRRDGDEEAEILVHAKIMIADDWLLRIGSANLSNRSMRLDTECDLALESRGRADLREAIAGLRNRLVAEHLGVEPAKVADSFRRTGSMVQTIESLAGACEDRRLRPTSLARPPSGLNVALLVDTEAPIDAEHFLRRYLPDARLTPAWRRYVVLGVTLLVLAGLAYLWRWSPLAESIQPRRAIEMLQPFVDHPLAPAAVLGAFVVGGLTMAPVTVLMLLTAMLFGPWVGGMLNMAGALLSAWALYGVGSLLGRSTVRTVAGTKLDRLSRRLSKQGFLGVVAVRLVPVAPYSVVNLAAGAFRIRLRDFMVGTAVGMAPGTLALAFFGGSLRDLVLHPDPVRLVWLLGAAVALVALTFWLRNRLARLDGRSDETVRT